MGHRTGFSAGKLNHNPWRGNDMKKLNREIVRITSVELLGSLILQVRSAAKAPCGGSGGPNVLGQGQGGNGKSVQIKSCEAGSRGAPS